MRALSILMLTFFGVFCAYLGACCSYMVLSGGAPAAAADPLAASRGLRAPEGAPPLQLDEGVSEEAAIRAQLGRATWELLHRAAAAFDAAPSPQRQADAARFFALAAEMYPCKECGGHFQALLRDSPVDARDNKRLSVWLCRAHNEVNARLGKRAFPCALGPLADRWGKCGCFGNLTQEERAAEQ
jgi:FAD-linked sulfhydryl oxidase